MDKTVEDVEVIESSESSEDNDITLTMESVPFKEKVEKWLVACNGAHANKRLKESETVFQQKTKTVVVSEIIDETESVHSVDTEQYIKSNRRKTTTKITTTTIKKYYSMVDVAEQTHNNNDEGYLGGPEPLPTRRDVAEGKESQTNRKKRNHPSRLECDNNHVNDCAHLDQVPSVVSDKNSNSRTKNARHTHATRLNDQVQNKNQISPAISKAFNAKKKPKRAKVTKKRNQLSMRGCRVKLKPLNGCADSVSDVSSVKAAKRIKSKLKTRSAQSDLNYKHATYHISSDSEQDDILLTSYKPFSIYTLK